MIKGLLGFLDVRNSTPTPPPPPPPQTLEGYGALTTGHLGAPGGSYTTYTVTNTNASGSGSLVNGLASNRLINFASTLSGTITIPDGSARIEIMGMQNITIDGTTAAYPGITITCLGGDGCSIGTTSNNILVKGLSFINCTGDGANVVDNATNVVYMNCTAYGNQDGNIDFAADCSFCTMQYCIIGNHNGAPSGGTGGTLCTGRFLSIHHNLFFPISPNPAEGERFPLVHRNYGIAGTPDSDVRSNLIYRFGRANATGSGFGVCVAYSAKANVVNNYGYTPDSAAASDFVLIKTSSGSNPPGFGYSSGNVTGNSGVFPNNEGTQSTPYSIPTQYQVADDPACQAATKILQYAGLTQRNPVGGTRRPEDANYINNVILPLPGC